MTDRKAMCMTIGTNTSKLFNLNRLFIFGLFAFFLHAGPADAYDNGATVFSWQANPPAENVTGYRLYYGSSSRFDSSGNPKSNFAYDYYIDLTESVRCNNLSYGNDCASLAPDELSCKDLNTSSPLCTLSYLEGTLHLAMTALDTTKESGYTQEIRISPTGLPQPPPPNQPQPPNGNSFILSYIAQMLAAREK